MVLPLRCVTFARQGMQRPHLKGNRMSSAEQEIDRLRRRLSWEAGGPLAEISAQATDGLVAMLGSALSLLRRSGQERPLISLLVAFEAGFAVGRWEAAAMRSVNLLKIAAEAEILRYRCMLARQGRRAAFGASALLFGIIVLVLGEIAGWQALHLRFAPIATTLILLGINLIIAGIFGVLAARSSPDRAEREALQVRRQALEAARGTLSLAALIPIGNTLLRHWHDNGARRRSLASH